MKKNVLFLLGLGLLTIIVFFVGKSFFIQEVKEQTTQEISSETIAADIAQIEKLSVPDTVEYFKTVAKEKGAVYAYELLRKMEKGMPLHTHMIGHAIGSVLYEQKGVDGLRFCTAEFAYSCYHSVLASVIMEKGFSVLPDLNVLCIESNDFWACQHGIGHGVLAVSGYDEPFTALDVCSKLSSQGSVTGCIEGVFMEFNTLLMLDPSQSGQRELSEEGMYYPCSKVAPQYVSNCYYEQPSWWSGMYEKDSYSEIGLLCDAVTNEEGKAWCYRRIGLLKLDSVGGTLKASIDACTSATSDLINQAYCLQMLRGKTPADAEVCNSLPSPYAEICESPVPER